VLALNSLLILAVSVQNKAYVISILTLTALISSLQPNISNVDCTEVTATIELTYIIHDTIWQYCIHHYCNTIGGDVVNKTVSMSCVFLKGSLLTCKCIYDKLLFNIFYCPVIVQYLVHGKYLTI